MKRRGGNEPLVRPADEPDEPGQSDIGDLQIVAVEQNALRSVSRWRDTTLTSPTLARVFGALVKTMHRLPQHTRSRIHGANDHAANASGCGHSASRSLATTVRRISLVPSPIVISAESRR